MFKTSLVSILMVTILVLLAAACAPAATAPAPAAPAAKAPATATTPADTDTSFNASTYTNDEYKFSIKYPKEWTSRDPDWKYQAFVAKPSTNLPSLTVTVYPEAGLEKQKELLPAYYDTKQVKDLKWLSNKDYTLKNGTKGELVDWTYTWPVSLKLESYAFAVDRNGKRFTFGITAVDGMMDYEFCKEMFNTLEFK